MSAGDRVYWSDGEPGRILAVDEFRIAIRWDENGVEIYSMVCRAIERIRTRALTVCM